MANIVKIDHGMSNWDGPLNQMLTELGSSVADSGWIDIEFLNGFENINQIGTTSIRKIGNLVMLRLWASKLTQNTPLGKFPSNFAPKIEIRTAMRGTAGRIFSMNISTSGVISFENPLDNDFHSEDYVGDVIMWMIG
ncbi:hypothetical protein [Lactiplantibacillus paraxiangfangensis]|uniref:hypothetical protein n=1 Tax=Lactiplantibacillus paraxiangfangensis TaxID=3076224 RepID=UPI0030C70A87